MREHLIPVLLGADLNCYSLARAFYEALGVVSRVFGREELGAVRHSRFLSFCRVEGLSDPAILREVLLSFAAETPGATRLLIPCTDEYVAALMREREELEPEYILPLPPNTALPLFDKLAFYEAAAAHGIDTPATLPFRTPPSYAVCQSIAAQLGCPFIIKPSSSIDYWHHPFAGMEKVYLAHNASEAECIFSSVFSSGYCGAVLAQRYIGGGDAAGQVLTLYFDRDGRAVLRAAGQVLLEEHTPKGKGNYAALLTAPIPDVAEKLTAMLSEIGYRGFANFDLRRDPLDGKLYVLELNLRQGRSNHFLSALGANPAELLCRDYILGETLPVRDLTEDVLFRTVPYAVVRRYTKDEGLAARAAVLHRKGRESCPLYAPADLGDIRRLFYVLAHMWRERKKFRRYLQPVRK